MASYELYTYCWDSEGQECEGFASGYEGEKMTPDEVNEWAKREAREEIKRQGGEIFHEEGNLMQYTYRDIKDMHYNEYLWVHGIEDGHEWDLEVV